MLSGNVQIKQRERNEKDYNGKHSKIKGLSVAVPKCMRHNNSRQCMKSRKLEEHDTEHFCIIHTLHCSSW